MEGAPMQINTEAVKKVAVECARFWAETDAKACSVPELIDQFMKSTDPALPAFLKLHSFVYGSYDHLGWSGLCEVCEFILANDLDADDSGIYHLWTFIGTAAMKDVENHSLEDRVRVAADVEAIFERAAKDLDYEDALAMGYFYFDHPRKAEQPQLYLVKSKQWFERAIELGEFNECGHHDTQTFGHVFFELGDCKSALHWYKKFEAAEDRCGDRCVLDRTLAEKRLAECKQRLSEL
jgi:hypothetical protein